MITHLIAAKVERAMDCKGSRTAFLSVYALIGAALVAGPAAASANAARPWTNASGDVTVSLEKGVAVYRGPRTAFRAPGGDAGGRAGEDLETSLEGGAPAREVRIRREVVYINCFRPRRLTTHGFGGVRRYNRGFGGFRNSTFGFDRYRRSQLTNC